jgi:hypothetical protein
MTAASPSPLHLAVASKEMEMSEQNWIEMNGVKIDKVIAEHISKSNFVIIPPPSSARRSAHKGNEKVYCKVGNVNCKVNGKVTVDDYPWIGFVPEFCASCGARACGCLRPPVKRWLAHFFVYDFYNPGIRGENNVVHHQNHDKNDARIKNLGLGTPRTHALAHNARRQKFSKKKKEKLGGFRYRPPQPARVVDRPELVGLTVPIQVKPPRPPSKAQRMRELDDRLARLWEPLSQQMKGMNSTAPVPRGAPESAWRSPKTWKLGISMPRLELTPGEAVFVLLAVKHGFAFDWMSRESGEPEELLKLFMKSPAVDNAITRWRSNERLPLAPM